MVFYLKDKNKSGQMSKKDMANRTETEMMEENKLVDTDWWKEPDYQR